MIPANRSYPPVEIHRAKNGPRNLLIKITSTGLLIAMLSAFMLVYAQTPSCNWPCYHGPDRTNKSADTGLPKTWPEGGPPLLWKAEGLGKGYSTVSFNNGFIFTSGMIDSISYVIALDMEGNIVWKAPNGSSWQTELPWARTYDGARSTPTCDSGMVYHLGELGRLAALDQQTGEEQWSLELRNKFDAEIPEYGYAESVTIEGSRLYCCPAGKEAYIVCLDKRDGSLIWKNDEIPGDVGFSSLIRYNMDGIPMLTGLSSNSIFSVNAETGNLLWTYPFENSRSNNIPDPIFENGKLFATSGYGKGSILLNITVTGERVNVKRLWQNDLLDNLLGGVILYKGFLYGSGDQSRGWFCIDFKTGNPLWKSGGKGSITFADGMLYCLDDRGTMTLVNANPNAYYPAGSFRIPEEGTGMYWAHPVVCNHKLYVRHDDLLYVYDLDGL